MSDQQTLEVAIQKAITAGWQPLTGRGVWYDPRTKSYAPTEETLSHPEVLLFNHDFAKALWPDFTKKGLKDGVILSDAQGRLSIKDSYKWHLEQMVIADDPIKYLGENI